jgi:hypothetical protein
MMQVILVKTPKSYSKHNLHLWVLGEYNELILRKSGILCARSPPHKLLSYEAVARSTKRGTRRRSGTSQLSLEYAFLLAGYFCLGRNSLTPALLGSGVPPPAYRYKMMLGVMLILCNGQAMANTTLGLFVRNSSGVCVRWRRKRDLLISSGWMNCDQDNIQVDEYKHDLHFRAFEPNRAFSLKLNYSLRWENDTESRQIMPWLDQFVYGNIRRLTLSKTLYFCPRFENTGIVETYHEHVLKTVFCEENMFQTVKVSVPPKNWLTKYAVCWERHFLQFTCMTCNM